MRIGHFDAGFGISGDMALGALLDAGASLKAVNAALGQVGVPGLRAVLSRASRCALDCARVQIRWTGDGLGPDAGGAEGHPGPAADHGGHGHDHGHEDHHDHAHGHEHGHGHGHEHEHAPARGAEKDTAAGQHDGHDHGHGPGHAHRSHADIRRLLEAGGLDPAVRERALAVFARLAVAEGRMHGLPPERVHFHEVGGEDAIGDVVGVCAAVVDLGLEALTTGPLPAGGGTVRAAHGLLPVPAPAVAVLLEGFTLRPGPVEAELVTPTGAALLAALATPAASWPALRLGGSGWGAGSRDFPSHPNACRLVWGEGQGPEVLAGVLAEPLVEIETNLDDQSAEGLGHVFERLFAAGALDVTLTPLLMKKQRPGTRLWALARPADARAIAACLLVESTALGLRLRTVDRWSLPRSVVAVTTPYGEIPVKVGWLDQEAVTASPEFEAARAAALRSGVPLKAVMAAALAAWQAGGARPPAS